MSGDFEEPALPHGSGNEVEDTEEGDEVDPIAELRDSIKVWQEDTVTKLKAQVRYLEEKLERRDGYEFKSKPNKLHFERTEKYRDFVADALDDLREKDYDAVEGQLEGLDILLKEYQEDLKIADSSEFGWETVNKLKSARDSTRTKNIRQAEKEIAEERAKKKRKLGNGEQQGTGNSSEVPENQMFSLLNNFLTKRSGGSKRVQGHCIWCAEQGHHYQYCDKWKADVEAGRAVFNTTTRRWEKK